MNGYPNFGEMNGTSITDTIDSTLQGYNSKVLREGDPCPDPPVPGVLRVYGMRFCSDIHQVAMMLLAKKIKCEVINVHLQLRPHWFLQINPTGTVPTMEYNGNIIWDSAIVSEWLDDIFDGRKLLPSHPTEKAKEKVLTSQLARLDVYRSWIRGNRNDLWLQEKCVDVLRLFEKYLTNDYFGGNEPTFVDYMSWPYVERVSAWGMVGFEKFLVTQEHYPKLSAYMKRMNARQEVQFTAKSPRLYKDYAEMYLKGAPDFDYALRIPGGC